MCHHAAVFSAGVHLSFLMKVYSWYTSGFSILVVLVTLRAFAAILLARLQYAVSVDP